jgi:hypothetical protein
MKKGQASFWNYYTVNRGSKENKDILSKNGLCRNSGDPDLWFSDEVEQDRSGRPSLKESEMLIARTIQALKICDMCSVKDLCLEEGMRKDNLEHGVWGGVMAGERMLAAELPILGFDRSKKITFANKVRDRIKFDREERYEKQV